MLKASPAKMPQNKLEGATTNFDTEPFVSSKKVPTSVKIIAKTSNILTALFL